MMGQRGRETEKDRQAKTETADREGRRNRCRK